ncbi:uncharacterized protein SRS1_16056 [Sporisorium reilianum f. sp. reilianum]|uniref:Uncharacterized protein n=1 Tax=Sporisorium reilianum f. sp. reilianum TaxID=72559 RepID=A0A2N8UK53_9BASI|nr:uncharacterized protein SRS1_16056 [Sporisorium reilianum f. sp. reilianum]
MSQPGMDESSRSRATSFKVSSHLGGVELRVSLADILPDDGQAAPTASHQLLVPSGHQFVVTAAIVSQHRPTVSLDDRCMCAITRPMSRNPAVTLVLIPARIPEHPTVNRRVRVNLEWIDTRNPQAVPLEVLFHHVTLPLHLRDLVSQLIPRLLIETLLRDSATAKLYNRLWQHRQRDTVPLISSIASSMRSLLSRTSVPAKFDPILRQLQISQSLPSVITIANLLTELDLARHPPSMPLSTPADRAALPGHQARRTTIAAVDFAPDQGDSDFDWIDDDGALPKLEHHPEDEHEVLDSLITFAPDTDQGEDEMVTHAAWAEIFRFSQEDLPNSFESGLGSTAVKDEPGTDSSSLLIDFESGADSTAAHDSFRNQHMSARVRFKPNQRI